MRLIIESRRVVAWRLSHFMAFDPGLPAT